MIFCMFCGWLQSSIVMAISFLLVLQLKRTGRKPFSTGGSTDCDRFCMASAAGVTLGRGDIVGTGVGSGVGVAVGQTVGVGGAVGMAVKVGAGVARLVADAMAAGGG